MLILLEDNNALKYFRPYKKEKYILHEQYIKGDHRNFFDKS